MSGEDATDDRAESGPSPYEPGRWLSAGIALIGWAVILQAVRFDPMPAQFWNEVVVGSIFVVIGGYNYYRRTHRRVGNVAAAAIVALLGVWLMTASFAFGIAAGLAATVETLGFWDGLFSGQIAFVLGADSAVKARGRRRGSRGPVE